jgi:hypothetical protein
VAEQGETEVRAELRGAPPAEREMQVRAQQSHGTLLDSELEVIYSEAGVVITWRRGERIDGAGPTPAFYYDYVGSAKAGFPAAD